jgi:hypothetical protein
MSVNDTSRIVIDNSRVTLQIVASLTDNSAGIIYNCNMSIVHTKGLLFIGKSTLHAESYWCYYHVMNFRTRLKTL